MGHASSKRGTDGGDAPPPPSRCTRFKRRLRHPFHGSGSGSIKNLAVQEFSGIARIEIIGAEMKFKDKWFACLSLGERTYRTETSDQTEKPVWRSEQKVVLEANGPTIARISVFETNKFSKNNLVGYCELNLTDILNQESEDNIDQFQLFDPSSSTTGVGTISIRCFIEDPIDIQRGFAQRVLSVADKNGDGHLCLSEFSELMNAFCRQLTKAKIEDLYKQADKNSDGIVDIDELAVLLAQQQQEYSLLSPYHFLLTCTFCVFYSLVVFSKSGIKSINDGIEKVEWWENFATKTPSPPLAAPLFQPDGVSMFTEIICCMKRYSYQMELGLFRSFQTLVE